MYDLSHFIPSSLNHNCMMLKRQDQSILEQGDLAQALTAQYLAGAAPFKKLKDYAQAVWTRGAKTVDLSFPATSCYFSMRYAGLL